MIAIKTVLKSSGGYKPEHVHRMHRMIKRYVKCPYKFICYTDITFPLDGSLRPLIKGWPGYWSKIELFRDIEDSFYIDLDMTICGDITDIVSRSTRFCALNNMNSRIDGIGSAVMAWSGDHTYIHNNFRDDVKKHIKDNSKIGTPYHGDQGFIYRQVADIERFQEKFPGRIERFNEHKGADIRVYYGRHQPW